MKMTGVALAGAAATAPDRGIRYEALIGTSAVAMVRDRPDDGRCLKTEVRRADSPHMTAMPSSRGAWRYLAAAAGVAVLGWFPFVRNTRVPLLGNFDLGMHELGHMLAGFMPTMVMFLMGSVAQIAVPLGLAAYFWLRTDRASSAFTLAWAGASSWDVSVYIADAPYERLPLIGGQHDWAYLLGGRGWNAMGAAGTIAGVVRVGGVLLVLAGLGLALYGAYIEMQGAPEERMAQGPRMVRSARTYGDPFS